MVSPTTTQKSNVAVYCDGSCLDNRKPSPDTPAGWGFVVVKRLDVFDHRAGHEITRAFGPVITRPGVGYLGAEHGSNQTAELSAMLMALTWIRTNRELLHLGRVAVFTDSKYAQKMTMRQWKYDDSGEMENKALVLRARELQDDVDARIRWVKGHAGFHWNEVADEIAQRGVQDGKLKTGFFGGSGLPS